MENLSLYDTSDFEKFLLSKKQNLLAKYLYSKENSSEKKTFIEKLKQIDFDLLDKLYDSFLQKENLKKINTNNEGKNEEDSSKKNIELLKDHYCKENFTLEELEYILNLGYEKIAKGKVALLILAGGQGSRLGFSKAKGLFDIGMPSKKSLFEYLSNRFSSIVNLSKNKYKNKSNQENEDSILLVMTSKENHSDILSFYEENNYFGIDKKNVKFFAQDTLPAVDIEGNIILKDEYEIFEAPNGNGGCFIALKNEKIIPFLLEKKIEYINVISTDNPLTKVVDPFFIGLTYLKGQKMSAKTIPKAHPKEPIGIFVRLNNKPVMIDYAELDESYCNLTENDNPEKLLFRASNMLHYLISVDLLQKILNEDYNELISDFHIANKNIRCYNNLYKNDVEKFISKPGLKFELFFNSVFSFADDLMLYEVDRSEEFAPIKNSDQASVDNPRITKQIMSKLFKKWLLQSKIDFKDYENKEGLLEISFLKSYDGENLEELKEMEIDLTNGPLYIK